ncbi:MAG: hypothetical protein JSS32_10290 [Verrucomicrobia bacterium]|nr:hypothetical protein [Verrucomicrobiota bacterium]
MFGQTFEWVDLPRLLVLIFIEILLSADNAIVLGVLTHSLPQKLRTKALLIGSVSAFFFRAGALFALSYLLKHPWIQILGGLYLIYLSVRHFLKKKDASLITPEGGKNFWKIVFFIELFDLAFAIDSILAGLAFIETTRVDVGFNPKLWIVYVGGMIGLFGIRYTAHIFSHFIDRFPRLEPIAYFLVGWIGIKLAYTVLDEFISYHIPFEPIFWIVLVLTLISGFIKPKTKKS